MNAEQQGMQRRMHDMSTTHCRDDPWCLLLQVAALERAEQSALLDMRAEWQREVQLLRQDVTAKRHMLAAQVGAAAETAAAGGKRRNRNSGSSSVAMGCVFMMMMHLAMMVAHPPALAPAGVNQQQPTLIALTSWQAPYQPARVRMHF
jgi:hypothetical protein